MAMETDDLEPRRPIEKPKDLTALSVAELNAYIGELECEITRAKSAIAAKQSHRSGAETLFKR